MSENWQTDLEILALVRKFEALRASMLLHLRNGTERDFFLAWSDLDGTSREAQWRLNQLRRERQKEVA